MEDIKSGKKVLKKTLTILLCIIVLLSGLALIFSIFQISGVENKIRYIVMIIIFLINILFIVLTLLFFRKKKKIPFIIFVFLNLILLVGQVFLSYYVFKTYSSISNMNKDKITYTSVVIVKNDSKVEDIKSLKDKKIGIVNDKTSVDGYIIPMEIVKDNKLDSTATVIDYESNSSIIKDLYDKKIDAAIMSKNYPSMFKSISGYEDVDQKTKIIYEKSKTLSKDEITKLTGDKTMSFSNSDKIDKPFTLLVMGIDSEEDTLQKNASGNGDSLMLITFNPKTLNATILSIPRDTYVPISCFGGRENKITHAAWQGEGCMIRTIENFTGINIDYYVKVNFQGVIKLVDSLGGIDVDVPIEFCESDENRSTDEANLVCLKKGMQTINGKQALALARHRKTLLTGDLQRGVNQQIVVQGMLNKIKSIKSANQMLNVLDAVSKNMDTNFTTKQILSFYNIAKVLMDSGNNKGNLINMTRLYLQGSSAMIYDEGIGLELYEFIPNSESLNIIVKTMKQNLGLEDTSTVKAMDFNIEETYEMKTIGENVSGGYRSYSLLPSFIGQSESYARSWCSGYGISVSANYKDVSASDGYFDGQIIDQSSPAGKRIDLMGGTLTITVARVGGSSNTNTENNTQTTTDNNTNTNTDNNTDTNTDNGNNSGDNNDTSGDNSGNDSGNNSGDNSGGNNTAPGDGSGDNSGGNNTTPGDGSGDNSGGSGGN